MAKFAVGVSTFYMAEPTPRHTGPLGKFGLREAGALAEPSDLHTEMPDGPERSVERCAHATTVVLLPYRNNRVVIRYGNCDALLRYANVVAVSRGRARLVGHVVRSEQRRSNLGEL